MTEDKMTAVDGVHPMASGVFERIQEYLDSGRSLASMPIDELQARFVATFKTRAGTVSPENAAVGDEDAEAEFLVRGIAPPYDLVRAEIEVMTRQIAEAFSKLSDEQISELNPDAVAAFRPATRN